MYDSFQDICKNLNYSDEDILKLSKKLAESDMVGSHMSSIAILCKLIKRSELIDIRHSFATDQVERNFRHLGCNDQEPFSSSEGIAGHEPQVPFEEHPDAADRLLRDFQDPLEGPHRFGANQHRGLNHVHGLRQQGLHVEHLADPQAVVRRRVLESQLRLHLQDPRRRRRVTQICSSAGKDNVKKLILPYYAKFLMDDEKEVSGNII